MKQLNTFKDVAAALREAEAMRSRGEIQKITATWEDSDMSPRGVCAMGGITLVAGMHGDDMYSGNMRCQWPILDRVVEHPKKRPGEYYTLLTVISQLNAWAGVSWLEIAEWLEGLDDDD